MSLIALLIVAVLFIVVSTSVYKLHPFAALVFAAFGFGVFSGMPLVEVVAAVNRGFGDTIGYIGIVIVGGSIIGTFLQKSGGAQQIAQAVLRLTGKKNTTPTMGVVGYLVSMPVFCDSGFVLLSPVNKALVKKAGGSLAAGAVALSLGLFATHSMVPPTPGPVAAAGILEADLGLVIVWGLVVSLVALIGGILFAVYVASKVTLGEGADAGRDELQEWELMSSKQPSALAAALPILFPIGLIVLRSIAELPSRPFADGQWVNFLVFVGQPSVALLIGVMLVLAIPRRLDARILSDRGWIGEAIAAAAVIIVITGAGGAFGSVLQASQIGEVIGARMADWQLGILLPFLVAAAIKTAQGSSTVAIVTTASLLAPLMDSLGFDTAVAKALVVVAIGAGSMVVSHANDSYFWVVTQFSGMTVQQGYKLQTLGSLVQGSIAAFVVWLLSLWLL
ncbi:GntP family permease [Exilibacterium tricleocarpae]|uniref:GntP family permease n=1 Tax=Exilibacterium tricleocarpae TaxID=2591008 RepID=A0A545TLR5_9GAMM|nr:GntP family permease [Exilibacterium tricleocarpae]TQV78128.1 GntP family permease [Exilibacterium tricleocarpae]